MGQNHLDYLESKLAAKKENLEFNKKSGKITYAVFSLILFGEWLFSESESVKLYEKLGFWLFCLFLAVFWIIDHYCHDLRIEQLEESIHREKPHSDEH